MSDLIDTTEMYLRTIYELSEEGVRPMRARIAERLAQSGPTVSQTVARMQRDGLVDLDQDDRHIVLTPAGAELATRVMRKHRLAECLLVDVIGLPWEDVHTEACRWEHVMSEAVERRLVEILGNPTTSPFGNPIPGLAELSAAPAAQGAGSGGAASELGSLPGLPVTAVVAAGAAAGVSAGDGPESAVRVLRIGETLQSDEAVMGLLRAAGVVPGGSVRVAAAERGVRFGEGESAVVLESPRAVHVVVQAEG